jgi:hypothetical protein
MRYINEVDGLKVVMSLSDLNDIVDELRLLTMPPVLAGLERLDAPIWFIARQLAVPEMSILDWKCGKGQLTTGRLISLCKILELGIKIYEELLTEYESDNIDRPFYEIGVLKEHIRSANRSLAMQREMIVASKPVSPHPGVPESEHETVPEEYEPVNNPENPVYNELTHFPPSAIESRYFFEANRSKSSLI